MDQCKNCGVELLQTLPICEVCWQEICPICGVCGCEYVMLDSADAERLWYLLDIVEDLSDNQQALQDAKRLRKVVAECVGRGRDERDR